MKSGLMIAVPQDATQIPHSIQRSSSKTSWATSGSTFSSSLEISVSWSVCIQLSTRLLIAFIQLPVSTLRSFSSLKTGKGISSITPLSKSFVRVLQARLGLPFTSMPQLPQIPARQTKSKLRSGSNFSRIWFNAINSVMPSVSSSS